MKTYNYLAAVKEDVKNAIVENYDYIEELKNDRNGFEQKLYDDLFISDSVTGNASGSYTFNAWQAEEYLCHNLELLKEACEEFCSDLSNMIGSAESCDVTIRCYLLNQAISEVLDDLETEIEDEDENENED